MKKYSILCLLFITTVGFSQEILPLWTSNNMPNHQNSDEVESVRDRGFAWIADVQTPTLEIYLPAKNNATGKAMIICPGGGYGGLAYDWEGTDMAKWLNTEGIAAFVLKYRLPQSKSVITPNESPLQDAQRAMRLVRHNAADWNIEEDQIGIMGFSAGGHLASTLGTHYDNKNNFVEDDIDTLSAKPNFMVLVYPVITMTTPHTHMGSRNNLIGNAPSQEHIDFYSNELHINEDTPPTILIHASDDGSVPVQNSLMFYEGLINAGVSAEMHIYPEGGHGFSFARGTGNLETWIDRCADWIRGLE